MRRLPRLGAPHADVRRVPSAPCAKSEGEGSFGRAGGAVGGRAAGGVGVAVGGRAPWAPALDGRMLLLATHDAADAQALDISDIITL